MALKQFARVVLAPMLEVDPNDVLYQAIPVLRVSHPSTKCMGKLHTDYESNNHQPAELNFWIPLCRAFGNNRIRKKKRKRNVASPVVLFLQRYCGRER